MLFDILARRPDVITDNEYYRKVLNLKVGDKIRIVVKSEEDRGPEKRRLIPKTLYNVRILKFYEHHVLTEVIPFGYRECFTYHALYLNKVKCELGGIDVRAYR